MTGGQRGKEVGGGGGGAVKERWSEIEGTAAISSSLSSLHHTLDSSSPRPMSTSTSLRSSVQHHYMHRRDKEGSGSGVPARK